MRAHILNYLLLLGLAIASVSCSEKEEVLSSSKQILAYAIYKEHNPGLENDILGEIDEATKTITLTSRVPVNRDLTADIRGDFAEVYLDDIPQTYGEVYNNFATDLIYIVQAEDGTTVEYTVKCTPMSSVVNLSNYSLTLIQNGKSEILSGTFENSELILKSPSLDWIENIGNAIATFDFEGKTLLVGEIDQESGVSENDYSKEVIYIAKAEDGTPKEYKVTLLSPQSSNLPVVVLNTENNQQIVVKTTWVNGYIQIINGGELGDYKGTGRIRGRGNYTWTYEKKPFRFKLDTKSEVLGMPSDKDWVLLAEYADKSLLRVTYGNELSKLIGMPWTSNGYHVELFMNNQEGELKYQGLYYLCEHVKAAPHRVDVDEDGFFIENDNYWFEEPVNFTTHQALHYTFKYPDSDDLSIGDPTVTFVNDYMNEFEAALYGEDFKDPLTGYRKYIDTENFAQWMLLQEVLGNIDTNPYFILKNRSAKLQMYPVWDFEWSLGLACNLDNQWVNAPVESPVDVLYWMDSDLYFGRMVEDPYFRNLVKIEWDKFKNYIPQLKERIRQEEKALAQAQAPENNFAKWDLLGKYISVGLTNYDTWQEEVGHAADFFDKRVIWLDGIINSF